VTYLVDLRRPASRSSTRWRRTPRLRRSRVTARRTCLILAAAAGFTLTPIPAAAEPGMPPTSQDTGATIADKARELEAITEEFNLARARLGHRQAAAQAAADALTRAQTRLATAREEVRAIARSAYVGGGLSHLQALLTSDSADDFVQRVTSLDMIAGHHSAVLGQAATAADTAAQAEATARAAAAEARAAHDAVATQRQQLQAEINEYQAAYDRLSAQDRGRTSRGDRPDPPPVGPVVASSAAAQIAVDTALAQLGEPYVWAAAGPNSFDCSGLVQFAYAAAGMTLPHSSAIQATMGRAVTRAELQPGDLVAFYSPVSHIGIYVGNGQMVHAPTSGDVVKVASIDVIGSITAMRRIAG
jgi:peptidoglycan DL-endopeptidase CwlO